MSDPRVKRSSRQVMLATGVLWSLTLKGLSAGANSSARGSERWSFLGANPGVPTWPKVPGTPIG